MLNNPTPGFTTTRSPVFNFLKATNEICMYKMTWKVLSPDNKPSDEVDPTPNTTLDFKL